MRMPGMTASSRTLRKHSVYTIVRLRARPATAALAVALAKSQDTMTEATGIRERAEEETLAALAIRDEADANLDRIIVRISLSMLESVANRREDPAYRRLFPDGAHAVTSLPILAEIARVGILEERLAERPDEATAKEFLPSLSQHRMALEAAVDAYGSSLSAEAVARAREQEAQEEWRRVYRRIYGELVAMVPEDRSRVESFFRSPRGRRSSNVEVSSPAEAPSNNESAVV